MLDTTRDFGRKGDLIVDCDDVLLNWIEGFRTYCTDRLRREIDPAGPCGWDMRPWLGLEAEDEVLELITDFNSGDGEYFARLPAFPDAQRALRRIAESGRDIHVVTSCSSSAVVVEQRTANLLAHFGDIFTEIICLDLGVKKGPVLERFHPGLWVEDNHDNGMAGADAGHVAYMLRRSHNRKNEAGCRRRDLTWVHDWDEIVSHAGL